MPSDGHLYWSGYLDPSFPTNIDDIVVREQYRRRGLGSILVEQAEKRIKSFGLTYIAGIAKEAAEAFWESQGYTVDRKTSWFQKTLGGRLPAVSRVIDMEQQYSLKQIKQMARQKGVSTAGSKRDIIRRLL